MKNVHLLVKPPSIPPVETLLAAIPPTKLQSTIPKCKQAENNIFFCSKKFQYLSSVCNVLRSGPSRVDFAPDQISLWLLCTKNNKIYGVILFFCDAKEVSPYDWLAQPLSSVLSIEVATHDVGILKSNRGTVSLLWANLNQVGGIGGRESCLFINAT